MILVLVFAILVPVALFVVRRDPNIDMPARLVAYAAERMPAGQQQWGRAMAAELTGIHGRSRRWRFALGALRVALLPPSGRSRRAALVAVVALVTVAGATAVAQQNLPGLAVFVGTFGVLLAGYATLATYRSTPGGWPAARVVAAVLAVGGVAAAIAALVRIGAAHPSAIGDPTHGYSVLLAVVFVGYLGYALARSTKRTPVVLWWGVGATVIGAALWTGLNALDPHLAVGVLPFVSPAGAVAVLLASAGAGYATQRQAEGLRAGLLTAILIGPVLFAIDLTALLGSHSLTLTDPYDIAAFARTSYPDVASFVLSDDIGGHIFAGLLMLPAILAAVATFGALMGTGLRRPAST